MAHLDPGKNDEACVVHNVAKVALALFAVPTNPTVPGFHSPRCAREAKAGDRLACNRDKVFDVWTQRHAVPQIVVALDILVPQPLLFQIACSADDPERSHFDVARTKRQQLPRRGSVRDLHTTPPHGWSSRPWKTDESDLVQSRKHVAAGAVLQPPIGLIPTQ